MMIHHILRHKLKVLKNNIPLATVVWFKTLHIRKWISYRINDQKFLERTFQKVTGKPLNLDNPTTYYQKLNWLKLYYRNPLMPIVSDKYAVRQYIKDLGHGDLLNEVYGVWENAKDFNPDNLPDKFVLKATHASGTAWLKIVKDKSLINWKSFKRVMNEWTKLKIDWLGREWNYGELTPRIIAEKFLSDEFGELRDYKFHCFNGRVVMVDVCIGRYTKEKRWFTFDRDWNLFRFTYDSLKEPEDLKVETPKNYDEMLRLADELCKPFPCVRVDFYNTNGRIYFGEFTFFDSSGFDSIYTDEAQEIIGSWLDLPQRNN